MLVTYCMRRGRQGKAYRILFAPLLSCTWVAFLRVGRFSIVSFCCEGKSYCKCRVMLIK